jgi:hypothetical protein
VSAPPPAKLLSFCLGARNDNYGGNFRYLITTGLNYLARSVHQIGAAGEVGVLIADWNSEVPLSQELQLSPEARAICTFVRVPPALAARHMSPGKTYSGGVAANVALRHATSQYLLSTNADVLYPAANLEALLGVLKGRTAVPFDPARALMLIRRKMLPWELVNSRPSLEVLDRFIVQNSWPVGGGFFWPGLNANNGGTLAHRELWHEVRGMDESLRGWGWTDIDLGLRVNQKYPSQYLTDLGVNCYELDVPPVARQKSVADAGLNPRLVKLSLTANDERWGLGDANLAFEAPAGPPAAAPPEPPLLSKQTLLQGLTSDEFSKIVSTRMDPTFLERADVSAGYLLAFCAVQLRPTTFLDFGFMKGTASLFVPALQRCVDIIGVNDWTTPAIVNFANDASALYQHLQLGGTLHFLSGETATALDRLPGVLSAGAVIDLIYLLLDDLPEVVLEQLPRLAPRLSARAAIVVRGGSEERFAQGLAVARGLLGPSIGVTSERDRTALLLHGREQPANPEHALLEAHMFDVLRPPPAP